MNQVARGADNDKNALLLARVFGARTLYIITNTNGVYADRDNPDSRIREITSDQLDAAYIHRICGEKSTQGTGGMQSKLAVARAA